MMMENDYPDAEIDKLIETFSMLGLQGKQKIYSGEMIDNDIRLSEQIREALDDIRTLMKSSNTRSNDIEKRKFLQRYPEVAELIGVSFTVDYLLPALSEFV